MTNFFAINTLGERLSDAFQFRFTHRTPDSADALGMEGTLRKDLELASKILHEVAHSAAAKAAPVAKRFHSSEPAAVR